MKIELTKEEATNIRVALRITMKMSDVNEEAMKQLLMLSDKFIWKDVPSESKKDT